MAFQTKDRVFLVMPAYNEEANIAEVVRQWHPIIEKIGNESKLVVVDDGSRDHTSEIMHKLTQQYPLLIPVQKTNSGHGPTCLYAYHYAVNHNADWIFQTDSDGQTDPDDFWPFWEARNKFDFIIGYRRNRLDGISRIFITRILKMVILMIFRVCVKDANTPFRLMKTDPLKNFLEIIPPDFFLSNVLISTLIVLKKEKLHWMPIAFNPRRGGENSISLKRIIKIGMQSIRDLRHFKQKISNA